jgi:uncharacterized protein (TIGR03437 family)
MLKNALASCVICLVFFAAGLQAQPQADVFAVSGANSTGNSVMVFTANPLDNITGVAVGLGTFLVLGTPDGSKFYATANSGTSAVTVFSNNFTRPRTINLGAAATAAAISEDGKRIAVVAGSLHIFDTSTDSDILPNGISLGSGYTVLDLAASLDGKTFYALGSNPAGGSVLVAVDASSGAVSPTTLPITGSTQAVAVGPNGLIYVSAPNQVLEINPATLTTTPGGVILVNAKPGKLVFTPDGLNAFAANETPNTGSAVLQIGLSGHAVVNTVPSSSFSGSIDQLQVLNSTAVLAYSSQNKNLYQITIASNGSLGMSGFSVPGISTSTLQGFALSNEVPVAGGRSTPQYLFAAANGMLYRQDLTTNAVTNFPLSIAAGGLSFTGAATTGTPATLLAYGNNQTIAPNAVSLPIVVRVLDNNGNALSGVTVTWGTNSGSASLSTTSATTGTNGYALTYVTPSTAGPLTVTATAGSKTATYSMSVTSGGVSGGSAGNIVIVSGQGQLVNSNYLINTPLTVQVNDTNGKPVVGASVTFAVTQGLGGNVTSSVVTTDNNGQASANFVGSTFPPNGTGYDQTIVNASAPGAGSANFYVTTVPGIGQEAQIFLTTPAIGASITGPAGSTMPAAVVVVVTSITGAPIPNVGITIGGSGGPSGTCNNASGGVVLTDATGTATCNLVLNGMVGTAFIAANVGYFQPTRSFLINITNGAPAVLNIVQGNGQTGSPGQQLPRALLVQLTDAFQHTLSGVPVTWSVVTPGTLTLSSIASSTDSNGNASAIATLGNIAGNAQVTVTAPGGVSATFTLTVNIPAAGISKLSGDAQTTLINTSFPTPLVVSVVDASGKPVQGATVTFQVTSGIATLGSSSTTTGANGQATTTVTAGATSGNIVVTATTATLSTTFNLTARLPGPSNVTFVNGASFVQDAVSPGAIVIIKGTGIAPGVQGLVSAYNLIGAPQPSLAGISVTFSGVTAPIYYVSTTAGQPDQLAVQVPFETQLGPVSVVINSAGGGSSTVTEQVQLYAPGVFQTTIAGQQIAVAVRSDGSYVSPSNPAHVGEVIQIFVTGLGQALPALATGSAGAAGQSVAGSVVVGLNNGGVPLISAVPAPGIVGVYILTLQVPIDTQTGPAQPVGVVAFDTAGNPYFAQGTVIPIQ